MQLKENEKNKFKEFISWLQRLTPTGHGGFCQCHAVVAFGQGREPQPCLRGRHEKNIFSYPAKGRILFRPGGQTSYGIQSSSSSNPGPALWILSGIYVAMSGPTILNPFHPMAHLNLLLKFCGTPKKFFCQSDKNNRYNFDSFTLGSYCCVDCCHFFIWQSKGREVSAPDWIVRYCMR